MRRTFVLVLGNHRGSFLEADRVFSRLGLDIVRASYNKVIDIHTFFVEVVGTPEQMEAAETGLRKLGVLPDQQRVGTVFLLELRVENAPGALEPILELVDRHGLNITYFNAKVLSPGEQVVRLGTHAHGIERLDGFLADVRRVCPAEILDYDRNEHVIDTNLFYLTFVRGISELMGLTSQQEEEILVNANRIVQNLEHTNNDPFRPFTYIERFARDIHAYQGAAYAANARVTRFATPRGVHGLLVEPPAGSDTWVLECTDRLLILDSGFSCYRKELLDVLGKEYPDWDQRRRELFLTHGDVDHVGCCDLASRVYVIDRVLEHFLLQLHGEPDWRMQIPAHMPYVSIGDVLSGYKAPSLDGFVSLGRRPDGSTEPIARCVSPQGGPATLDVEPFHFEVWEGAGGHVLGETVLIDRAQRICVSGDVLVNVHGETRPQARFNSLAPFLMTSVDSNPALAGEERAYLRRILGSGHWQVLGGHGALMEYDL